MRRPPRGMAWVCIGLLAGLASGAEPEPPPGDLVVDVQVVGNRAVASERILSKLTTYPGRPFNKATVREDVRRLFGTHWFYDVAAEDTATPQGVIVTYHVIERPTIQEIRYVGNRKLKEKQLKEVAGLEVGKAMDPGQNQSVARRLEEHYREKGYPFATVKLIEGGQRDDSRVAFEISEGPKTKVRQVALEGNTFVGDARLKVMVGSKASFLGIGGGYDPVRLEEDLHKLIDYYRQNGFLDVRVARRLDWTENRDGVRVTFVIEEGPRYKVRDVRFAGATVFDESRMTEKLALIDGKEFNQLALDKDLQTVRDEYGGNGYIHTLVNADVRYLDEPGAIDIVYQVTEDRPRRVGRIQTRGNEITKDSILRNRMEIAPGDIADTRLLRLSELRLRESRLFHMDPAQGVAPRVEFDPANDPDAEVQDLLVTVQEAQTGSLLFGVGMNSDSGFGGSLVLHERNFDLLAIPRSPREMFSGRAFRGAGQELRIEAVPGTEVQRYSVQFREPRLLGLHYSLSTSGYLFRRIFSNYDEERAGGRFTLGKRFTREIGTAVTYRIENVEVSDLRTTAPDLVRVQGDNFLTSVLFNVDHDTRDSYLSPGTGHLVQFGYEQIFGDFTFPKFTVEGQQFFTLFSRADGSGKHILSIRGEVGYADDAPVFERFYAGGFRSLRGFDFRGVGPTFAGTEIGGDFLMLTGAEYHLPLTADDALGLVFFTDAGTVEESAKITTYRVAVGFGLRVQIPGFGPVPLAFDFGFPIVKGAEDDTQIFSFFVGVFQ